MAGQTVSGRPRLKAKPGGRAAASPRATTFTGPRALATVLPRAVPTAATPGVEAKRSISAGERVASGRLPIRLGGET
jgi:hypothetical protein